MALARKGSKPAVNVWPGFVDAMAALLMVMMFVLSIFMVLQSVLRDTITTQDAELTELSGQLSGLAQALSLERARAADLETAKATQAEELAKLGAQLALKTADLGRANAQISDFEARVAALAAQGSADAAQISALREKLKSADDEVALMALALEEKRKAAEEALTLLAAAQAAKAELAGQSRANLTEAERRAGLLAVAETALAKEKGASAEAQRKVVLLNEQLVALRSQLADLQGILDEASAKDRAAKVQVDALGNQLNAALARVAAESRKTAELEAAERKRLEAEAKQLERYRSEFFGRISEVLAGREGVRVVGDRFVFSSEVLFDAGRAELSAEGRAQIKGVAGILAEVAGEIPPEIDWIIRVDGHTDATPLSGAGEFADNWELSQARALSVVRYLTQDLGFDPKRLAAAGFGEFQPVSDQDAALNRRIELKLTER